MKSTLKKAILFIFSATLSTMTADALADADAVTNLHQGFFLSGNMGVGLVDSINKSGKVENGFGGFGIGANVGYQFNPYVGMLGGVNGYFIGLGTLSTYELAAKGVLPLNQNGEFFGKLGVGLARLRVCFLGCESHSKIGPTIGLGFAYDFTQRWAASLEYNAIYLSSPYSKGLIGALSLGVTRHFDA